jgi:hypothetical protein
MRDVIVVVSSQSRATTTCQDNPRPKLAISYPGTSSFNLFTSVV